MYVPPHFQQIDPREIASLIECFPLACIVAQTEAGLIANHIPLIGTPGGEKLVGHVALVNEMHRMIPEGQEVLAIFRGADAYISPNYYPTKAEHHRHVPTWNYEVVHLYGTIHFQHDEQVKRSVVGLLTSRQEKRLNGAQGWRMSDAPPEYLEEQLGRIVALRIETMRTLAKSKLSQNRESRDYLGAIEGLKADGQLEVAKRMSEQCRPNLPD